MGDVEKKCKISFKIVDGFVFSSLIQTQSHIKLLVEWDLNPESVMFWMGDPDLVALGCSQ